LQISEQRESALEARLTMRGGNKGATNDDVNGPRRFMHDYALGESSFLNALDEVFASLVGDQE
jgi:hypothetical protein